MRNAFVSMHPAEFQDYGHGDEAVQFKNASASVTFPKFKYSPSSDRPVPFVMNGDFAATVKGTPVEGGSILMTCSTNGDNIFDLEQEQVFVRMRVKGDGVRAARVASFLSLPFRADEGRCAADIELDFLYNSESEVPIMRGDATLTDVALRFHPDPKTPEFQEINGTMRFDQRILHIDNSVGSLGSLPMSVDGSIDLEDGYDLKGYVSPVNVNNILDTFEVEKFVPIQGMVYGHLKMSGAMEEPMLSGQAESVDGSDPIFDRLPLSSARLTFNWDAVAGVLRYPEITAAVEGGGSITGSGSMYFDMTKENEWNIRSEQHSERNPKALYWNGDVLTRKPVPPHPTDIMEIDEYAPCREYDSMMFTFHASKVDGGNLLYHFGGEYGVLAQKSVGRLSGEAVIAGHMKDANCRVLWKSIGPPPNVPLSSHRTEAAIEDVMETKSSKKRIAQNIEISTAGKTIKKPTTLIDSLSDAGQTTNEPDDQGSKLGGGDFSGLVYLKLGDSPEARRVKVRTIVQGFDARRAGWEDKELRNILGNTPHLNTSMDTFFKGVMFQQPILEPGTTQLPRTPRMKMLGVDGAVAVRGLKMNGVCFKDVLSGSFAFGTSDFSMSLKQVETKVKTEEDHWDLAEEDRKDVAYEKKDASYAKPLDQLKVSLSLSGEADVEFRRGDSEIIGTLRKDEDKHIGSMMCKNIVIQDFFGRHLMASGADALKGRVDAKINVDVESRQGYGEITVEDVSFGPLHFSSFGTELELDGDDINLKNGWINYRTSTYALNGRYATTSQRPVSLPSSSSPSSTSTSSPSSSASASFSNAFESNVTLGIRYASFRDISKLIREISSAGTALLQHPGDMKDDLVNSHSPVWLLNLVHSKEYSDEAPLLDRWDVPPNLNKLEKEEWELRVAEERKELRRMGRLKKKRRRSMDKAIFREDGSLIVEGGVSGEVCLNYNSTKSDETSAQSTSGNEPDNQNILIQTILDHMAKTSFSVSLRGEKCRIGNIPLRNVTTSGFYEDGVLNIGPMSFEGDNRFGAEANARITRAGGVDGSFIVRYAPADLVQRFSRTPVQVNGDCSGRLEVEGNLANPRVLGRMVWTDASLNGKQVRDARTDLACVNGRCLLNVDAKIGGRRHSREQSDKQRLESLNWGKNVSDELKDLAARTSNKRVTDSEEKASRRRGQRGTTEGTGVSEKRRGMTEDGLQVQVSAPVRFYLVNYLRRKAEASTSSIWTHLEPVLGSSFPSDDGWIVAKADVKKYGLILLNTIAPQVGWEGGDSDVVLRMSGSVPQPVISGRISVRDGRMSPNALEETVTGVKGEIVIGENGVLALRSISGRCGGKWITAGGDMFLTKWHREQTEQGLIKDEETFEKLSTGRDGQQRSRWGSGRRRRVKKRAVMGRINDTRNLLQRTEKGLNLEFGDIGVDLQKALVTKISGRVTVNGVIAKPTVGGSLTLSDGVVFLGNVGSASLKSETNGRKHKASTSPQMEAQQQIAQQKRISTQPTDMIKASVGQGIKFDGLKVSLGRNVKMVQSFLLNIQTTGDMTVNGTSSDPDVSGSVRLVKGSVNLLASRMRVSRGENSYVKLLGREAWDQQGLGGEPEMMMRVVMENDDLLVRIGECRLSNWLDTIQVLNKRRELYYYADSMHGEWDEEFRARLGDERSSAQMIGRATQRYEMKKMVINSLLRIGQLGGKFGRVEWRLFPVVVSKWDGNGIEGDISLKEDVGGGGRIDVGGLAVSSAKSVNGFSEHKLEIRFGRWGRVRFGANGRFLTTDVDLFGRLGKRHDVDRKPIQETEKQ